MRRKIRSRNATCATLELFSQRRHGVKLELTLILKTVRIRTPDTRRRRGGVATMSSMASWALAGVAAASAALPVGSAANPSDPPPLPGGVVAPGPRGAVTLDAMLAAIGRDAARRIPSPNGGPLPRLVEPVTWADCSLGCPVPGRTSTRAQVPGWLIMIGDGKRWLGYHASQRGAWLLCPPGRDQAALPGANGR